jgi:hypothetical protein
VSLYSGNRFFLRRRSGSAVMDEGFLVVSGKLKTTWCRPW